MTPLIHMNPSIFQVVRIAAGVNLQDAAAFMGVSASALSRYERWGTGVSDWKLYRASDWLRGVKS